MLDAGHACRPPKPPTYTPNAHGLAWSPPRCAPSARSGESAEGPPPQPLSDPYVTLSRHTAPVIQPVPQLPASDETAEVRRPSSYAATAHYTACVPTGSYTCVWPIAQARGRCAGKCGAWLWDRTSHSSSTTLG